MNNGDLFQRSDPKMSPDIDVNWFLWHSLVSPERVPQFHFGICCQVKRNDHVLYNFLFLGETLVGSCKNQPPKRGPNQANQPDLDPFFGVGFYINGGLFVLPFWTPRSFCGSLL